MLKKLLPDPDVVLKKCVDNTLDYLTANPSEWTKENCPISREKIADDIGNFFSKPMGLKPRTTKPDELVSDMLELVGGVNSSQRVEVQRQYNVQKQIEMRIGDFLEMYLLKHSYQYGWVQSGNCISAVDLIKKNDDGSWFKLQVKNSDNTPNSSSAGFVAGKAITWKRRNSNKGTQYWDEFPDDQVRPHISEIGFNDFVKSYFN